MFYSFSKCFLRICKAFFSIRETYERDMPNFCATSRCGKGQFPQSPYLMHIIARSLSLKYLEIIFFNFCIFIFVSILSKTVCSILSLKA